MPFLWHIPKEQPGTQTLTHTLLSDNACKLWNSCCALIAHIFSTLTTSCKVATRLDQNYQQLLALLSSALELERQHNHQHKQQNIGRDTKQLLLHTEPGTLQTGKYTALLTSRTAAAVAAKAAEGFGESLSTADTFTTRLRLVTGAPDCLQLTLRKVSDAIVPLTVLPD